MDMQEVLDYTPSDILSNFQLNQKRDLVYQYVDSFS